MHSDLSVGGCRDEIFDINKKKHLTNLRIYAILVNKLARANLFTTVSGRKLYWW